jgi:hypothetical protein
MDGVLVHLQVWWSLGGWEMKISSVFWCPVWLMGNTLTSWVGAKGVVCSDGTLLNIGNEDGFLHKA